AAAEQGFPSSLRSPQGYLRPRWSAHRRGRLFVCLEPGRNGPRKGSGAASALESDTAVDRSRSLPVNDVSPVLLPARPGGRQRRKSGGSADELPLVPAAFRSRSIDVGRGEEGASGIVRASPRSRGDAEVDAEKTWRELKTGEPVNVTSLRSRW